MVNTEVGVVLGSENPSERKLTDRKPNNHFDRQPRR